MAKTRTNQHDGTQLDPEGGGSPGTAVSTIAPPSLLAKAEATDEVASAFGGAIADQTPRSEVKSVPLIQIDHRESKFSYSGELLDAVEGYPIHWLQTRSYWEGAYTPGKTDPPDCWSPDTIHLSRTSRRPQSQDGLCASCPMSKFGSAKVGQGQACKTQTFLFLVNPHFGTPAVAALILPPSNIKVLLGRQRAVGYLGMVKRFRDPETGRVAQFHELAWTRFRLERVPGAVHSVVVPTPVSVCRTPEEAEALAQFRGRFIDAMESMRGTTPEVATPDDLGD